ncbi:hypothetical protein Ahy_B08g091885 isoform D [Arachis hypogaea]|uniref:Uncharacterized protein n=1 Tax=Arachis hypogaea TaxID=3818 RepID=A0A444Y2Q0_ARAHY|nr:hypothetical protein Ahy_B08g091885 isoform D [Arachis hypogaea]
METVMKVYLNLNSDMHFGLPSMNLNNEAKLKGQVKGMHVALEFHLWYIDAKFSEGLEPL